MFGALRGVRWLGAARGAADGIAAHSAGDRGCHVGGFVWILEVARTVSNCAQR